MKNKASADQTWENRIAAIVGVKPDNKALYKTALRHKSSVQDETQDEHNERLEFLGDALLSSVVADHLYHKFPTAPEGRLSRLRAKIVSRSFLNGVASDMGMKELVETELHARDFSKTILGNALEALIGAVYIDHGYKETRHFILTKIIEDHIDEDDIDNIQKDYKSRLFEWTQREGLSLIFKTSEVKTEAYHPEFHARAIINGEVKGEGKGKSKKKAEQKAARAALEIIS